VTAPTATERPPHPHRSSAWRGPRRLWQTAAVQLCSVSFFYGHRDPVSGTAD